MPELPEVEVVRAGLAPFVTGATVRHVEVLDERSLRRHPGPSEDFIDRLTGSVLAAPSRRGKFLWLPLVSTQTSLKENDEEALVAHLGMSGQMLLRSPGVEDLRTRIRIDLGHPERSTVRLNFVDQRIFGSMMIDELVPVLDLPADAVAERIPASVSHIARDPLDPHFDDTQFLTALRKKHTGVKRALLNQTLISGIGNIYADEALWASRIHFNHPADALSRPRATLLLAEVRTVLRKALAEGGSSFDEQYLNVNGESGHFTHLLNAYGQQGKPCPRCGHSIVREQFMNRGSHFCRHCQRTSN